MTPYLPGQRRGVLGNSHREFVTAWDAPNHDTVLDSDGLEFEHGTFEEGVDCGFSPLA